MRLFVLLSVLLVPTAASAAKKKKPAPAATEAPAPAKEESPPPPAPKVEPADAAPPQGESWGAFGAATLGSNGLRAQAFGGNHDFGDGFGYGGLDAMYFVGGTGKNVDFGVGLKIAAWPLGFAPQAEVRWRVVQSGFFHFGLQLAAAVPLTIRGMVGGFTYSVNVEPGLLFSFFIKENMEIFVNVTVPGTLLFSGLYIPVPQIGFTERVGFVYTFVKPGIGLMFSPEITPGFFAPKGAPRTVGNIADNRVAAGFMIAYNFKLGVQVRF